MFHDEIIILPVANGFSSGAGGCGPAPSIGFPHTNTIVPTDNSTRPVTIYPFNSSERAVTITISSRIIQPDTTVTLKVNRNYAIKLSGYPFKGFLFRLAVANTSSYNLSEAITPFLDFGQVPAVCTGSSKVTGITHTSNSLKNDVTGFLYFEKPIDVVNLDVTVVFLNNNTGSEYSSAKFNITVAPCTKKKICGGGILGFFRKLFNRCITFCD
jgi:hypothetical protein